MHEYVIEGGYPISGTITASGNKNAALPCLAATLLTSEPVILKNIPEIQDTNVMIQILESLGAKVKKISKNNWEITILVLFCILSVIYSSFLSLATRLRHHRAGACHDRCGMSA